MLARMALPERSGRVSAAGRTLTLADTRITVGRRTARWSDDPVTATEAMDFWSFAAGAVT